MPRETPSPIDLPAEPLDGPGLGWTATILAIAAFVLLAANAVSLCDWANDLTPSPAQARLAGAAEDWLALTEAAGIAKPRDWLHVRWKQAEAARFDGDGAPAPR